MNKEGGTTEVIAWVRLPREYRPKHFDQCKDPVVPLLLALYGHPDSGGYWEKHSATQIAKCGFHPVPGWNSVYYNRDRGIILMTYVDDFKMSGPCKHVKAAWVELQKHINMEEPKPIDKYLGCNHNCYETYFNGNKVNVMEYDVSGFMQQCVESYIKLAGGPNSVKLRKVKTPFLEIADTRKFNGNFLAEDELEAKPGEDAGQLADVAASVLMKILYGARQARWDLLKGVSLLATRLTKWTKGVR